MARLVEPFMTYNDNNGAPLSSGLLQFNVAGSPTLAKATFSDPGLATANPNPIILNSAGRVPDSVVDVFGSGDYRMIVKNSAGVAQQTFDPLGGAGSTTVATYVALKALADAVVDEDQLFYVVSRTSPNDGGEGFFTATTSSPGADDDATILHSDTGNRFFERQNVIALNPEWWGAAGDGVTDNSAALNAMFAVWIARDFAHIVIPPKSYLFNTTLNITFTSNDTKGKTISAYGAQMASGVTSGNAINITAQALVRNLTINGGMWNGSSGAASAMIHLDGGLSTSSQFLYSMNFNDMHLEGFTHHGWHVENNTFESKWTGCSARASAATGACMFFEDGTHGTVSSIILDGCITSGGDIGVLVSSPVSGVQIQGGTFILAQRWGMQLNNAIGSTISQAHFENNWEGEADISTGGAGLKLTGSGDVTGVSGTTGASGKQRYVVEFFISANKICSITGGRSAGSTVFYAKVAGVSGSTAGTLNISGAATIDKTVADITIRRNGNDGFEFETGGPSLKGGSGSPEGVVTSPVGSKWYRSDGADSTSEYIKGSGAGNTGWVPSRGWIKHATVHTDVSSGTTIDWTGLPADVTQIKIVFSDQSFNTNVQLAVHLGDSSSYETSGYGGATTTSAGSTGWSAEGLVTRVAVAADVTHGMVLITHQAGNQWQIETSSNHEGGGHSAGNGSKTLTGVLTRVRFISDDGAGTFDATGGGVDATLYSQ